LVITPESSANYSQDKAETALSNLKRFIQTVQPEVKVNEVKIDIKNVAKAVSKIMGAIKNSNQKSIYTNLRGGMRLVILETLISLIQLGMESEIDVEPEDMSGGVRLYTGYFDRALLEYEDKLILASLLGGEKTLLEVTDDIRGDLEGTEYRSPSRVTIWRRLESLERRGFVNHRVHKRIKYFSLTPKGEFFANIRLVKYSDTVSPSSYSLAYTRFHQDALILPWGG